MKEKKELKVYELLGIKTFRKMVFKFCRIIATPFTLLIPKEERKKFLDELKIINYNIGGYSSKNLHAFKKYLFLNSAIHVFALLYCIPAFLKVIGGTASFFMSIIIPILIVINSYCIILQRYNYIRIKQVIKKITPYEEKQKTKIKEQIKELERSLDSHTYVIIKKNNQEKEVAIDELMQKATLEELKKYREYLNLLSLRCKLNNYVYQNNDFSLNLKENKILKFKLNSKE